MITGVLRNFATLPGKHLCQVSGLQPETWHRCFPVNFSKFLGTLFYRTPSNNYFWLQVFRPAALVKRYSDTAVFL